MAEEAVDILPKQSLETLDTEKLTPISPDVIARQATINFGTIGHVAHGKSTVVRAISGVHTVRFRNEKERNITIKLGYANAKIYKCTNPECKPPGCFASYGSTKEVEPHCLVDGCGHKMKLVRHVSFVDCPGHDILMATMLNGAAVMDAALLLIAGNEPCPQPQTSEHLAAVEIMRLQHVLVLQNKVELIKEAQAQKHYDEIKKFLGGTVAANSPVIPISAVLKYNIDVLCEYIYTQVPVPIRDFKSDPEMIIIRSFDVNKPGDPGETLQGGVAGGSILKGVLKVGDVIEVRPGIMTKDKDGKLEARPIRSVVTSLFAEQNDLAYAVPGGLIGVGTKIDPTLTRSDRLVGQVLGYPGRLPDIYIEIEVAYYLLRRLLGVKTKEVSEGGVSKKSDKLKISGLKKGEYLMVNVGSTSTGGRLVDVDPDGSRATIELTGAVCTKIHNKVALSRRVDKHWRLIGWGAIVSGKKLEPTYD